MGTAIKLESVYKAFGRNVIYENLNLEIEAGEVLTILGGSGTGKSVMLKMMLGLVTPDSGRVYVDGEDITDHDDEKLVPIRRKVGMLFQGAALFDSLTVFENVAYPARVRNVNDPDKLDDLVHRCLAMVGLDGVQELMPAELSGGMRKRIGLARAVSAMPSTLLYDEPTTGLDPTNVRRINDLILNLRSELNLTSVVVTHDLASTFMVSDRIAMLARNRIVEIAATEDFRRSRVREVREFLSAMPATAGDSWMQT